MAATLTVRDEPLSERRLVPRAEWTFAREDSGQIVPDSTFIRRGVGFEAGKIYELFYRARNPVIVGLGFLAFRDVASYAKYHRGGAFPALRAIAYGKSQSGRFLRQFLYEGFNTDERGRQAFDGVLADVAGAGRGSFNYRFAAPSRDRTTYDTFFYPVDLFPFTSGFEEDPLTRVRDGLLTNHRAARHLPKLMQVNTGYEYWAGAASLVHADVEGTRDLSLISNERLYFIGSGSHNVSRFPPLPETQIGPSGSFRGDPLDTRFVLRALLEGLRAWIGGHEPPSSRYPRIVDGTLVPVEEVRFPAFDGIRAPKAAFTPRRIDYGPQFADGVITQEPPILDAPYRVLVPQVDEVGNDRGGVPTIETLVPLATYTGWQLRTDLRWDQDVMAAYSGAFIPLLWNESARQAARDPRPSVQQLYPSREAYRTAAESAAKTLIASGFLLPEDSVPVLLRADSTWDWIEMTHR
jgi:hypothetical protein